MEDWDDAVICKCCAAVPEMVRKLDETHEGTASCFTEYFRFEATCRNPGTLQTAYHDYTGTSMTPEQLREKDTSRF